jgi:hypothetical protein
MAPQTPLLLIDNVFDTVGLYPGGTVDAISEVAGREAFRVADYRRDRTYWQPTSDGGGSDTWVRTQLLTAHAIDSILLDRGHNLTGKTVFLEGGPDGASWPTSISLTVPGATTIGGTPAAPTMAQTEEGTAWTLFATTTARLWWRLRVPYAAGFIPIVTGIIAGARTQLLGYSTTYDEDAGGRTQSTQMSSSGYLASDTTYSWRTAQLGLSYIGSTEYDGTIRTLRNLLFARNQPTMLFMDYGTYPERGWLYQYDGTTWGMPKTRVYRSGPIPLRECGPRL